MIADRVRKIIGSFLATSGFLWLLKTTNGDTAIGVFVVALGLVIEWSRPD